MKKIYNYLLLLICSVVLFSCEYDDDNLWQEVNTLKTEVATLKNQASALQVAIDAINNGKVITSVDTLANESGYKITFNDGKAIEVLSSDKKIPIIGVQKENDTYYWTITTGNQTQFLLSNEGEKLPVTGLTPQLEIDSEGYWTINGTRILDSEGKPVKAAGETFFSQVTTTDENLILTLSNGTELSIPLSKGTYLTILAPGQGLSTYNFVAGGSRQYISYDASGLHTVRAYTVPQGWNVVVNERQKTVNVDIPATASIGIYEIPITALDDKGLLYMAVAQIYVSPNFDFSSTEGAFILNEGNMTNELGMLSFIDANGSITDSIYWKKNNRLLGNVAQDLFFYGDNAFIITQNGNKRGVPANDGMLVKVDANTFKTIDIYESSLKDANGNYRLSWPTHLAVTGIGRVFIRDNSGIHLFDPMRNTLSMVEGTENATKNRMAVIDSRVYAAKGNELLVIDGRYLEETIDFGATITGVVADSQNEVVWVATFGDNTSKIYKIDAYDIDTTNVSHTLPMGSLSNMSSVPSISVKDETIYYTTGTKIYRHTYDDNTTKEIFDVKTYVSTSEMLYNGIGVHPTTGDLYVSSLDGYSSYASGNNILIFSIDTSGNPTLKYNIKGHTRFPAGIFFRNSDEY